jgi:DNA-directed RNA polymerase subunit RPC12/RpoP
MNDPPPEELGFRCRRCGSRFLDVVRTVNYRRGKRRTRRCVHCGFTFSTYERELGVDNTTPLYSK